ncbi:MAG: type II secretion system F family protein, partial [bacterium]|nr:type II secretion system F family protein [bacterium]
MKHIYLYRARDSKGELRIGKIGAESQNEALDQLQAQGLLVVDLQVSRDISHQMQGSSFKLFKRIVPLKDLAIMARQLSVLYNAGVPMLSSLKTVYTQTQNALLKATMRQVTVELESGLGLGEAMKKHPDVFPAIFYNMVSAGEVAGALDEILDRAAKHFEREHEISSKVKSALFYPKLVVGAILLVGGFLVTFVVPVFADMFSGMGVA